MEREHFQESREKAKKNIKIADHMLSVTYPLVKDARLLLTVMENIFLAYTNAMAAILYHERLFKRIPPFQDNFGSKFAMFREIALKHKFDKSELMDIQDIKEVLLNHKKSPIEFARKGKFVICSDSYRIKAISPADMQSFVSKAKVFIDKMESIVGKDDKLFG